MGGWLTNCRSLNSNITSEICIGEVKESKNVTILNIFRPLLEIIALCTFYIRR